MSHVTEIFGSKVFNASVMKERLPEEIFELMQKAIKNNNMLGSTAYVPAVAGLYITNYIINDICSK